MPPDLLGSIAVETSLELVRHAKRFLRQRARSLRGSLPADALARRSAEVVTRLRELPELTAARSVALFWPIDGRGEIDLRPLDRWCRARYMRVAYPAVVDAEARAMVFRWVDDVGSLVDRGHRFSEPPPEAPVALELDIVVIAALAIDARGHRLGYGAGYYDRALPSVCPPALKIGTAYDHELASDLPCEDHDVPVDVVVTDARRLDTRG